jgi:uncharacterized protein YdaU (DUF1376 family)
MNWYKRYPTAFQNKTLDLNFRQIGIYNLLLDYQYQSESAIKNIRHAMEILRRMATPDPDVCSRTELRAVKFVLKKYFVHKSDGHWNPRALEEIEYVTNKRTQAQKAARARHRDPGNGDTAVTPPRHPRDTAVTPPRHPRDTQTSKSKGKEQFLDADLDLDIDVRLQTIENTTTTSKPTPAPSALSVYEEPVVPITLWLSFVEMRKKMRKPLTDHGGELIRRQLQRFKDDGEDPIEILEKAIRNNWMDVFSLKGKSHGQQTESFAEKRSRTSAEAIRDIFRSDEHMARKIQRTLPPTNK